MKICVAQTIPIKGEITKNIQNHKNLIDLAIQKGADIIIFPELSLTGYEPALANQLSTTQNDKKLDVLQDISTAKKIIIGAGLPTKSEAGVCISMVIFEPNKPRKTYSKQYLHPGEETHFVTGQNLSPITLKNKKIALAICYETSVDAHSEKAFEDGASIYIASVLNSVSGVDKDLNRIGAIAKKYKMSALMANFVGKSGEYDCAGKSSVWNNNGEIIKQLDTVNQGLLILDTDTQLVYKTQLETSSNHSI